MIKRLLSKKLVSKRGFSLAELMIVLVIMTVISLAISIGITSAAKSYRDIRAATESSVLCSMLATELSDTLRYATDIQATGAKDAVFTHRRYGIGVSVTSTANGRVFVGAEPVLSEGSYTQLHATAKVTYNGKVFNVQITVYDYDGTTKINEQSLTIAPLSA